MSENSSTDVLSAVLGSLNLGAKVFGLPAVCGQWQINTTGVAPAQFHLVTRGSCYLHMRHLDTPIPMRPGDLAVAMHGDWHVLSASPVIENDEIVMPNGKGPFTNIICGQFDFPVKTRQLLIDLLPSLIVIRSYDSTDKLESIVRIMVEESFTENQGGRAILDKLSDILFILVLRHYINTTESPKGLIAGLSDPKFRILLAGIHRYPGEHWSIERMLGMVPMSRSSLIERFTTLLGMTPMNYLAFIRMQEAERLLSQSSKTIAQIAADLGYSSEAAFRRAYKRINGENAAAVRKTNKPSSSGDVMQPQAALE